MKTRKILYEEATFELTTKGKKELAGEKHSRQKEQQVQKPRGRKGLNVLGIKKLV